MKISLAWLSDFIDITESDPSRLAAVLTERTAEIEEMIDLGKAFDHVVVGQILAIDAHPNADKVRVTKIDMGDSTIRQIICGAQNIEVGQKVPVALPGAVLPGDFRIEKRAMRGVESEGMLCSGKELGIAADAVGIFILDPQAKLGTPLADHLGLGGIVIDIDNTAITNRPDLFSQYGFARELVANGLAKWKKKEWDFQEILAAIPENPLPVSFAVESPELCPARAEAVVEGITIAESPDWLKERLDQCGVRPINNIVDISNFVMLELGMPLHTFDLDAIKGDQIQMRLSRAGEKVTTLDGITRELPEGIIVQEDENGIFDLAGIMGGAGSGIGPQTTRVLVHVPVYDPVRIRKGMLALAHRTDAATIYEKRVPNASVIPGILRCLELIKQLDPSARVASRIEWVEALPTPEALLPLPYRELTRVIGKDLPAATAQRILTDLDFTIVEASADALVVRVPAHRTADIAIPEDLIEEIVRVYGVNTIEPSAPQIVMQAAPPDPLRKLSRQLSDFLTAAGCTEMLNFAFLGPELLKRCGIAPDETMIEVQNPLSVDQSLMRQSLMPRLLEKAADNRREREAFDIFEIGKTFAIGEDGRKSESTALAVLCVGKDFLAAKSLLMGLSEALALPLRFEAMAPKTPFAAHETAIKLQNTVVGSIFELTRATRSKFSLPEKNAGFSLVLEPLAAFPRKNRQASPLPRFPAIELDLSVLIPLESYADEAIKGLKQLDPLIETATVIDIFTGEGLPEGKKSVTLHFSFRAGDRTLSGTEADELKKRLLAALEKRGYQYRF